MVADFEITQNTTSVRLDMGALGLTIDEGALRCISFGGVEVVRGIAYPVRDAEWRTREVIELEASAGPGLRYVRNFRTVDGDFTGSFDVDGQASETHGRLVANLRLTAERDVVVMRAGFVLLHPIAGVAGEPVEVTGPDGLVRATVFPERIMPSQPVFDIAGLRHRVGPVAVDTAMEGDVFEMEDQRNWTDASFKTYCRPLGLPRPFTLAAGETIHQRIVVDFELTGLAAPFAVAAKPARAVMPQIMLAHETALCGAVPDVVARLDVGGVLLRVDGAAPEVGAVMAAPVTLEVIADDAAEVERIRAVCAEAGVSPQRVVAVPRGYLASHQPEGPWPEGLEPMGLVPLLRAAFPEAEVGGGMLTNFTEFNRKRVAPELVDFVTFGTTAIVHAADDASVLETLEALGDVFASARALSGHLPLRLGLMSIGMRSNPYGAAVAANPEGRRVAMAMEDPRQQSAFGAAFAVGVAAAAARGGVASYAPAMTGGPLGLGSDGALWPIHAVVAALADLAGVEVEVSGGPSSGVVALRGRGRGGVTGIVANLGPDAARFEGRDLAPMEIAVLRRAE